MLQDKLILELQSRIPELEWKISVLGPRISPQFLPKGLFQYAFSYRPKACVEEIKNDIKHLAAVDNERSAHYLADKIRRKISVIVALCNEKKQKNHTVRPPRFTLKNLSSRQELIQTLGKDIQQLTQQRNALKKALDNADKMQKIEASLALQSDLGNLEEQLTRAQERLDKIVAV